MGRLLGSRNVDIQTIEEYRKLKEELEKYCLTRESLLKLVSALQVIVWK
jgi:hypothetical protein